MHSGSEQGRLAAVPLDAPELVWGVGIVHRKRKKFNGAARAFLELVGSAGAGDEAGV